MEIGNQIDSGMLSTNLNPQLIKFVSNLKGNALHKDLEEGNIALFKISPVVGSTRLVVMERGSCSRGCVFKSQNRRPDG